MPARSRAGLALGTWMVLLAADVAVGRPVVGEMLLETWATARVRVARIGTSVNAMAATENGGDTVVEDLQLVKVLDSLGVRVAAASEAVAERWRRCSHAPRSGRWPAAVRDPAAGPARQGQTGGGGGSGRR